MVRSSADILTVLRAGPPRGGTSARKADEGCGEETAKAGREDKQTCKDVERAKTAISGFGSEVHGLLRLGA